MPEPMTTMSAASGISSVGSVGISAAGTVQRGRVGFETGSPGGVFNRVLTKSYVSPALMVA